MSHPQQPEAGQQWQPPQPVAATPPAPQPRNGFGTTALVLGIVGAVFALIPIVGVIAWPIVIVGLTFGILGILRAHKGIATNKGAAISGTALSAVGLALCIIWTAAFGASVSQYEQDMRDLDTQMQQGMPEPVVVPTPSPIPESAPGTIPGSGTYLVGQDIEPGTYKSAGPAPSSFIPNCYWERAKDASGQVTSIIANGNAQGLAVVTIKPSDAAFKAQGCQPFELVEK